MPSPDRVTLHRGDRMFESATRATSMVLPVAVHRRLDELADLTGAIKSSRAELVAMLVANAELDADALEAAVLAYRKMTVAQVLPPPGGGETVTEGDVVVPMRGPGRPKRAS
jgi:hypothetical protein